MINKIAAGEVIERPASVIKELMENSIDAEAKRIEVIVEQAGMSLLQVIDDGVGIAEDQLLSALKPHATSKITDTDDLFKITTFGFRGEALASIAEISHLTLKSCAVGQSSGGMVTCNGGEISAPVPCGMPVGTQIEVKNLFFNTPVRRKYVKSPNTEMAHVTEVFVRLAIPHPEIHFVLRHNGRVTHDLPANQSKLARIKSLFHDDVGDGMVEVVGQSDGDVRIEGYVSLPSQSKVNNKMQYLFLNGRFIRDRSLQHALMEAYRGLLVQKRYPIVFLNIVMSPDKFDVNVHPMKLEVRFLDSNRIYSGLLGAIRNKFMKTDLKERVVIDSIKSGSVNSNYGDGNVNGDDSRFAVDLESPEYAIDPKVLEERRRAASDLVFPASSNGSNESGDSLRHGFDSGRVNVDDDFWGKGNSGRGSNFGVDSFSNRDSNDRGGFGDSFGAEIGRGSVGQDSGGVGVSTDLGKADSSDDYVVSSGLTNGDIAYSPSGRAVIQMHDRYLVMETADGIAIIDQHALHERILYEQLKELMGGIIGGGKLERQRLLVPVPVDLSPVEFSVVMDNLVLFADLGLQVEAFGGDTVIISSLPSIIFGVRAEEILLSLIEPLLRSGTKPDPMVLLDEMLHSMACKAAIKAGEKMRADAIANLIKQAEAEINSHHCPHGRPSSLIFTRDELDKRFRRM
jgi:DNA mismatch repair protein MutL